MPRSLFLALLTCTTVMGAYEDVERPPVSYSTGPETNAVRRLIDDLKSGKRTLAHDAEFGYLPAVLKELEVPRSSQTFVFSKTSLQRNRISPKTPRAIYFNDEITVGFCQHGDVVELTANDPNLGVVFYTVDQNPKKLNRITRHSDQCLICHSSSMNRGYPGHLLRSVTPDRHGELVLSFGSKRIDYTSPFQERWGGWYVTGTAPKMPHRGNVVITGRDDDDPRPQVQAVTSLKDRFTVANYLEPHSDIVALMVLEHQTELHNRIARANYLVRYALAEQAELNKIFKEPGHRSDGITRRIHDACEQVVLGLLYADEATFTGPVTGTSSFAKDYVSMGPKDSTGRSLREFDLNTRLFKYPCSPAIYSAQFNGLPAEAKSRIWTRLDEILTGKDTTKPYGHLTKVDRQQIREILHATLKEKPPEWKD